MTGETEPGSDLNLTTFATAWRYVNVGSVCWRGTQKYTNPCCTIHTNNIVVESLWPHKCKSGEAVMLAGRLAQRMLVWCSCCRGGCDGSHFHLDVLKNILSFTRDASLLRGQHSCFLSSLCRLEKGSRAQRVLMPGRISDGAGRLSASRLSLHEPQRLSSKHRWCGFNWLQLSRSLFTK